MENALKFVNSHSGLIDTIGFYLFFLGLLLLVAVVVPLLFEKERWVLPGIIVTILLVGISAVQLEKRRPLLDFSGPAPKIVIITKEVKVPVFVPVETPADESTTSPESKRVTSIRPERTRRTSARPDRTRRTSTEPERKRRTSTRPDRTWRTSTSAERRKPAKPRTGKAQKPREITRFIKKPSPRPAPAPSPSVRPPPEPPRRRPEPAPPVTRPEPAPPPKKPKKPAPPPSRPEPAPPPKKPKKPPPPPSAKRTEEGMVLPAGNLVIQISGTMLMTVPKVASKARLSVIFDGRYVGGKGASSLRKQKDEQGNVINVTYFWKGVTVRLNNQPTGNHRISIRLKISGNGVNKSTTAWSGAVYIGKGTKTLALKGGWGSSKLRRIQ